MRNTLTKSFILLFTLFSFSTFAQQSTQTVRGSIIDQQADMPLIGATIELLSGAESKGVSTDIDGRFEMTNVPLGRHQFRISYIGYNTVTLPNILVTAGKEVILDLAMEESTINMDEVVVTAKVEKDQTINEMAGISARTFSLEEVTRYSGGANDVSRMASNFAGVSAMNDGRNDIVIRGNSPTGVLWRLEGIPIPNPNHFNTLGSTGGPISALNTNMLKNSDFMTSAFPAEYGNANAGVFDIGFRNGNRNSHEFTTQLTVFNGLEFMAEGPLSKKKNSSYMVSYRYSFVELAQRAGINVGTASVPRYQDLAFKLDFGNGKAGKFSFFGLGGVSNIDFLAEDITEDDLFSDRNDINAYATSQLAIVGMNHRYILNETTYVKTTLSASTSGNAYNEDLLLDDGTESPRFDLEDTNNRYSINSFINKKFNAKATLRAGVLAEYFDMNAFSRTRELEPEWRQLRDFDGGITLLQPYAQVRYKPLEKLIINAGLHGQYLALNDQTVVEPRLAINYNVTPTSKLSLGYGLHSQMQPLPIYFFEFANADGTINRNNQDLEFTRSHHLVLGFDQKVGTNWRIKVETYYQWLTDVPVDRFESTYSVLNTGDDFGFDDRPNLINDGTGNNYGFELTVEKFFSNGYYGLVTASIFDSNYTPSDGVERNTSFNNRYTFNFLAGKEWYVGKAKQNAITFDMNLTTAGGRYYTPIDLEESRNAGFAVRDESRAYSERYSPYFRFDAKIGYRMNSQKRKFAQTFYLDFRNLTNNKNIFAQRYNETSEELYNVYQIGFFPDFKYQIQF
ncbi:MAG: carboxypeptidase-like regulatory domain-containing protein [Saprospiraceae bacterium]